MVGTFVDPVQNRAVDKPMALRNVFLMNAIEDDQLDRVVLATAAKLGNRRCAVFLLPRF